MVVRSLWQIILADRVDINCLKKSTLSKFIAIKLSFFFLVKIHQDIPHNHFNY